MTIKLQHQVIASWLRDYTPKDSVIATNDIGVISYLTERRVVDLGGLESPAFTFVFLANQSSEYHKNRCNIFDYLESEGVQYLAIYKHWFGWLFDGPEFDRRFQKVFEADLKNKNSIAGGQIMEVYKLR